MGQGGDTGSGTQKEKKNHSLAVGYFAACRPVVQTVSISRYADQSW